MASDHLVILSRVVPCSGFHALAVMVGTQRTESRGWRSLTTNVLSARGRRPARGGVIVNIASTAGIAGIPHGSEYCAAKGAVIAMTRGVAIDYSERGVRINAVLPGATRTSMLLQAMSILPGFEVGAAQSNSMGRLGQLDETAYALRWLLSGEAGFVTGFVMPIDGGATAQ